MIEALDFTSGWKLAMLPVFALIVMTPKHRIAQVRVWLTMIAASVAAYFNQSNGYYLAVDLVTATIIMLPPKCRWQRILGVIYLAMAFATLGYMVTGQAYLHNFLSAPPDPMLLKVAHDFLAWMALLALIFWAGDGLRSYYTDRDGASRNLLPTFPRGIRARAQGAEQAQRQKD